MPKTFAYLRVSSDRQDIDSQRLKILEYARRHRFLVDEFVEFEGSSRISLRARRIEELLEKLAPGDTLVVVELSRIGRSLGEIIEVMNELARRDVYVHIIEQGMRLCGAHDMATKVQIAMFGIMAEVERDLISERTKAGVARARAEGKQIGRPKGSTGKSVLDGRESQIKEFLGLKVSKASIAKICGVSWTTLDNFIRTRSLED